MKYHDEAIFRLCDKFLYMLDKLNITSEYPDHTLVVDSDQLYDTMIDYFKEEVDENIQQHT